MAEFENARYVERGEVESGKVGGDVESAVNRPERIRKPEVERTEPVRNWSRLFKTDDPSADEADDREPGERGADPVADGVRIGYQVIEDYLRYGEKVARGFTGQAYGEESNGATAGRGAESQLELIQDLVERTTRNVGDWMGLWLSQVSALGDAANGARRTGTDRGRSNGSGPASATGTALRVVVDSPLPVEVSYELFSDDDEPLRCHPLHAADEMSPRLCGVSIERGEARDADDRARLSVVVPADQPPGVYSGVIVAKQGGQVRGTVTVEISKRT